jgi:hypothetical protein
VTAKRRRAAAIAALSLALLGSLSSDLARAQADEAAPTDEADRVVMTNGDVLTGEVKSLDRGMLRFETDATDTIEIQWSLVAQLTSAQNFQITIDDDRQLYGSLLAPERESVLLLDSALARIELPLVSVVRMNPIEGRLIDRIEMSVDLGYNFSKANDVNQTNFGYDLSYRSEERLIEVDLAATRSSSSDQPKSIRYNSSLSYRRFIGDRSWDPMGFGGVERNDELGLDRRVTVGGGMSHWLTDTSTNRISFMGGVVGTRENETDAVETETSIEAAVGLTLDWFRYDDPELDVAMNFTVYERLSDGNRTRGTLDVDMRWELASDFYWGFTTYYSFNTDPTGDAASEDYGIVTTIGWSF